MFLSCGYSGYTLQGYIFLFSSYFRLLWFEGFRKDALGMFLKQVMAGHLRHRGCTGELYEGHPSLSQGLPSTPSFQLDFFIFLTPENVHRIHTIGVTLSCLCVLHIG